MAMPTFDPISRRGFLKAGAALAGAAALQGPLTAAVGSSLKTKRVLLVLFAGGAYAVVTSSLPRRSGTVALPGLTAPVTIDNPLGDLPVDTNYEIVDEVLAKVLINAWESYENKPTDPRPITPTRVGGDGPIRFGAVFQYDGAGAYDGHFVATRHPGAITDWRTFLVSLAQGTPSVP